MNVTWTTLRPGLVRGWIELRNSLTNAQDIWSNLINPTIFLVISFSLRGKMVQGTNFSLGSLMVPSILGMTIAFTGMMGMAQLLTVEREDGTLLRAKATPNGIVGYLVGKIVTVSGQTLILIAIQLIPALFLFDGVAAGGLSSWLTLAWVLLVGLVATMPLGAIIGSLFSNVRTMTVIMLPIMGLTFISGIFFPIRQLPEWVQWIGQMFPMYWLGLGMRSALLPDAMAAVELGQSWRHWETLGVLGAWAVFGIIIARVVLRRMARRESGSSVAARREKALQRIM